MARALMILGTASDVGKSVVTAGLCRIFHRSGLKVAPFKAQNMSLNSNATPDGKEIGWAQAAQAEACGVPARVDMNPVLLKPTSNVGSQVVLQGKVYRNMGTRSYYASRKHIWAKVQQSYNRLSRDYPVIVLEGAGGAAEINLRQYDLSNFRMAHYADANVILVGDIERGGVLAALVGTLQLLKPGDRERIKGIIVNKFRGDKRLFEGGVRFLERETGVPVLGVLPYYDALVIPEEDSVALERIKRTAKPFSNSTVNIAVISLPHMANYTDFAEMARERGVVVRYIKEPEELFRADVVIVPGSKNTLKDLMWLRRKGWERKISSFAGGGGSVIGVCGGYQMLGEEVADPFQVEGQIKKLRGLGLLPLKTVLMKNKTTTKVVARSLLQTGRNKIQGYEIHMGNSQVGKGSARAFEIIRRGSRKDRRHDGAVNHNRRIWGTYLHGIFANPEFRRRWLHQQFRIKGLGEYAPVATEKDPYDLWASHLYRHLDMKRIFELVGAKKPKGHGWTGILH